jgi:2-polyprenyl-6-methoxyphenol hydroxylase-like FAD-dependent oxidoreductase
MDRNTRHVIIVGGGSAGWLTAALIAAEHRADRVEGLRVTLVESPDVGPIGVGEGTWPTMRDTLRRIGVSETAFLRECDASFKQGSRFDRWVTGRDDDRYYHPFVIPLGYTDTNLVAGWLERHRDVPFADLVSFQPHLCAQDKAPKQPATPEYAAVANYAYHLDAGKFGVFLRAHCTERLGVKLVLDHVTGFDSHDNGDLRALLLEAGGILEGDLFVDCTGLQSLLLGGHFGIEFRTQKHVLFNDTALALQVPYPEDNSPVASQTISTAQRSGWIWDIGLPTRRGVGYVFSSAHTSIEEAERELRSHVERAGGPAQAGTARRISFTPGYRREFWHRNCVAIGLSAGFIEPLEASALVLVELSAAMVADQMPVTRSAMDTVARRFNDSFTYRWERVIDFLKMHYVLTRRTDTPYWRDNGEASTIPERLREQLALWRHQPPSRYDFHRVEEVFPSASHQYVLYGMGFRPQPRPAPRASDDADRADGFFRETAALTARMLAALPTNRELLGHVRRVGLPKV